MNNMVCVPVDGKSVLYAMDKRESVGCNYASLVGRDGVNNEKLGSGSA